VNDNADQGCTYGGFAAVKGYDASSGLGAPRFDFLYEKLLRIEDQFSKTIIQ